MVPTVSCWCVPHRPPLVNPTPHNCRADSLPSFQRRRAPAPTRSLVVSVVCVLCVRLELPAPPSSPPPLRPPLASPLPPPAAVLTVAFGAASAAASLQQIFQGLQQEFGLTAHANLEGDIIVFDIAGRGPCVLQTMTNCVLARSLARSSRTDFAIAVSCKFRPVQLSC